MHNAILMCDIILFFTHNYVDDNDVRGPGICRRLALRRTSCWDGDNERDTDIEDFDFGNIDAQGNNI